MDVWEKRLVNAVLVSAMMVRVIYLALNFCNLINLTRYIMDQGIQRHQK